jgi:hypothetical protein
MHHSDPMKQTNRSHSPGLNALRTAGRVSQRSNSGGSFLREMETCERLFFSKCQLDRAGRRTDKPRPKIADANVLWREPALQSAKKLAWLRDSERGI